MSLSSVYAFAERRSLWLAAVVVAGCAAGAVFIESWILRNAAVFVGLFALALALSSWLRRERSETGARRRRLAAEIVCPLVVVAASCGVFHRIFTGDVPYGSDHPIHMLQGWVMAEHLLPTFRVSGWVHLRGAGYPAGVLYPIGADLFMALVRYLTPSSVPDESAYAIAFFLAMTACHLAAYLAGRLFWGPLAGMFAGLFSIVDAGGYCQSGWFYAVQFGVWKPSFSMAFALAAVALLHRALARDGYRSIPLVSLLAGASIVVHPMSLAFLGVAVPVVMAHSAIEETGRRPLHVLTKGAVALGLGVALASFWLVPFLAFRSEARAIGRASTTLRSQAYRFVDLTFFDKLWVAVAALALLGGILAWKRKLPGARLFTILIGLIAILSNGTTLVALEVDRWFERLSNMMVDRFYIYIRPMAYVLAGIGAAWVAPQVRAASHLGLGHLSPRRRALLIGLACLAFGGFVAPVLVATTFEEVVGRGAWVGEPDYFRSYLETCDFIRRDVAEKGGHVRTLWPRCPEGGTTHCFESSPIYTDVGVYHPDWHSGATFKRLFGLTASEPNLRYLGVRYRVQTTDRRSEEPLFRSGPFRVYEVRGALDEPFSIEGEGEARVEAFEDERIRLAVTGAGEGSRLTLHVAYFPNWHAFVNGEEVPISLVRGGGIDGVMQVPLRDGTLELRYLRGFPEASGAAISLLALLVCGLVLTSRWVFRERLRARLSAAWARLTPPRVVRVARIVGLVALVLAVLGGGVLLWRLFWRDRPEFDTVNDFGRARVFYAAKSGGRTPCPRYWFWENRCGPGGHQWVGPRLVWIDAGELRGVVFAHPVSGSDLHVDYPRVRLGERLVGGMGIEHDGRGGAPVRLGVRADGRELFQSSFSGSRGYRDFSFSTAALAEKTVRLEFVISSESPRGRHFVFRAHTED